MKDTYYMKHDINASQDDSVSWMRSEYGAEGYGLYWLVNEYLRNQSDCIASVERINTIAFNIHVDPERLKNFITDCIDKYGLYDSDDHSFWSKRILKDKQHLDGIREKNAENARKRWKSKADGMRPHSDGNATVMQEKKRKEKKSKEEVSKEYGEFKNIHLSDEEFKKCVDKHSLVTTNKAIEKLSSFKASSGKSYKSDYAAMNTWVWKSLDEHTKKPDVNVDNSLKFGGLGE